MKSELKLLEEQKTKLEKEVKAQIKKNKTAIFEVKSKLT